MAVIWYMKNCFIGKSKSNDENINNLFEEMETLILLKTYGQYYFIKRAVKKIFYIQSINFMIVKLNQKTVTYVLASWNLFWKRRNIWGVISEKICKMIYTWNSERGCENWDMNDVMKVLYFSFGRLIMWIFLCSNGRVSGTWSHWMHQSRSRTQQNWKRWKSTWIIIIYFLNWININIHHQLFKNHLGNHCIQLYL